MLIKDSTCIDCQSRRSYWSHPDVEEASLEPGNGHGDISDSAQGNLCIQVLTEGLLQLALHKLSAMQQVLIAGHHLYRHTGPNHSKAVAIECAGCITQCVADCIVQPMTTGCMFFECMSLLISYLGSMIAQ